MNLYQIYRTYWAEGTKELVVQHTSGMLTIIDGHREEDPEGGCMATGTPACLLGRAFTEDGSRTGFWFDAPAGFTEADDGWKLFEKRLKPVPYTAIQDHHIAKLERDVMFWKWMFLAAMFIDIAFDIYRRLK